MTTNQRNAARYEAGLKRLARKQAGPPGKTYLRKIVFVATLAFVVPFTLGSSSCSTPPSARVVQVQTLKSVGQAAEAAVVLSAKLYAAGQITASQAREVFDFYDGRFQPAFRVAVTAVNANLDSVASPDIAGLATQLLNLVASYRK